VRTLKPAEPTLSDLRGDPTNPDPYNENMAIGDLPAGLYKVTLQYRDKDKDKSSRPG
jgi:hypothetical protein